MFANLLQKIIGDKSGRDIKQISPYVDKVKTAFEQLQGISHDELRNKTTEFRQRIADNIADQTKEIEELKASMDSVVNIEEKEANYERIDALEKESYEKTEELLLEILPEAFAVIKETARRFTENDSLEVVANDFDRSLNGKLDAVEVKGEKAIWKSSWTAAGAEIKWEMVHYDVQLIGGTVLHKGNIAEMATGEGKTLVATLPVYLNALPGKGVHLVTVNNYLAQRDAEWMGPIFQFHGLSIDCIDKHQPNSEERRQAYLADITYGTNNEFGFDYLRDNMAHNPEDLVQRKHNYAIVDEVDSVLIDDARTPLIISGPTPKGDLHEFNELKPHVSKLVEAQKVLVARELKEAKELIAAGDSKMGGEKLLRAHRGLPKTKAIIKFLSEDGMRTLLLV